MAASAGSSTYISHRIGEQVDECLERGVIDAEVGMDLANFLICVAGGTAHDGRYELRLVFDEPTHVGLGEVWGKLVLDEHALIKIHDQPRDDGVTADPVEKRLVRHRAPPAASALSRQGDADATGGGRRGATSVFSLTPVPYRVADLAAVDAHVRQLGVGHLAEAAGVAIDDIGIVARAASVWTARDTAP
jgi:hypothetical protein